MTARVNYIPGPRLCAGRTGLAQFHLLYGVLLEHAQVRNKNLQQDLGKSAVVTKIIYEPSCSPGGKITMRALTPTSIRKSYQPIWDVFSLLSLHARRTAALPRVCRLNAPNLAFHRYSSTTSQPRPTLNEKAKRLVVLDWPAGGQLSL